MNRAERRRAEKEKLKFKEKFSKMPIPNVDKKIDYSYEQIQKLYQKDMEQIEKGLIDICAEQIVKDEQCISVGTVLIALKSLELTFGHLKTVQRGMNHFLQNFDTAMDLIDKTGIAETYRQMQERYGLNDLVFEDPGHEIGTIENIWANNEQKVSDLVRTVWKRSSQDFYQLCEEVKAI